MKIPTSIFSNTAEAVEKATREISDEMTKSLQRQAEILLTVVKNQGRCFVEIDNDSVRRFVYPNYKVIEAECDSQKGFRVHIECKLPNGMTTDCWEPCKPGTLAIVNPVISDGKPYISDLGEKVFRVINL